MSANKPLLLPLVSQTTSLTWCTFNCAVIRSCWTSNKVILSSVLNNNESVWAEKILSTGWGETIYLN